ncbi:MAG: hypothetical protein KUG80_00550 [Gammaproteobacteria bacterium]|nr:hypothetical protein [Gammaproteobacteria bacterium]
MSKLQECNIEGVAGSVRQKSPHAKAGVKFIDNRHKHSPQKYVGQGIEVKQGALQLKVFTAGPIQLNGNGLRRRFPAPPEPEREPEREYHGPPLKDKIAAYLADAQARPEFYAQKGLLGSVSFIMGQIGLNVPRAIFNLIKGAPGLLGNFNSMIADYKSGNYRNASASATTIASTVASIVETAIGTHGMVAYATTGGVYGAGLGNKKLKKD